MDDERIINARKKYSQLINKSKQQAKKKECLWCGKQITRFCNSHSVPQCILRNIDEAGKLDYFNSIVNLPLVNKDKGIAEAGTFKLVCPECDSRIFQDYEDIDKLNGNITERMLEEIALKNILMMLNKRYFEIELFKNMQKEFNMPYPYDIKQEANALDERDFWLDYMRVRDMIRSEENNSKFKMFFYQKLDYVIPIAFQGIVTLYGDLEGNMVTDIYNKSEEIVANHMHICMFPLADSSVVFAFYHEDDTEYDAFVQQFELLSDEDKLKIISYIVYDYCEDMFFAKKFPHRTWFINKVRGTFLDTTEILAFSLEHAEYQKKQKMNALKNMDKEFPCILSKKFAVNKEC
ncbi:MAG: hypothetical protein K6A90_09930 [Lachnospiraceae bacterium]|nr:hypothetical protein [Lachnospiraceae bacterium]